MTYDLVVVGGGAAGFFAAINTAIIHPGAKIIILEKSQRVLQKVKISGGGRCNVTNAISEPVALSKNYPRGEDFLVKPFIEFTSADTIKWFEYNGVLLKTEPDGRIFPTTDSSQTIIDCFLNLCNKLHIEISTSTEVKSFKLTDTIWESIGANNQYFSKNLLIATGSSPAFWKEMERNEFLLVPPVPSLFTFTIEDKTLTSLQGVSIPEGTVSVSGSSFSQSGPILITHWGISGPSVLKLSAIAARHLNSVAYNFPVEISWLNKSAKQIHEELKSLTLTQPKKNIISHNPFQLPSRLWKYLCEKAGVRPFQNWAESGKKTYVALIQVLSADTYKVLGKSTYKDEFVSAGGLDLDEINESSYEHSRIKNLYFAGEVLNIDGFTGGFNFQAAWTSGYLVAANVNIII